MRLLLPLLTVLISAPVWAQVVVVHGPYRDVAKEREVPSRSEVAAERIEKAVRDTGVKEVVLSDRMCADAQCLGQVVTAENADRGMLVLIKEDFGEFSFTLLGFEEPLKREGFVSFSEALNAIYALVQQSIKESTSADSDSGVLKTSPPPPAPTSFGNADEDRPKALPALTWIFTSAAVASATALIVTEVIGAESRNALDSGNFDTMKDWQKENDKYRNLKISSRILAGSAVAMTGIAIALGLSMKLRSKRNVSISLSPSLIENGGIIGIRGTFSSARQDQAR